MRELKKKILAMGISFAMVTTLLVPFASAADFDMGTEYKKTADAAEMAKTEELYQNRPVMLKQAEDLDRGLVAVPSENGGVLVSWRYLGTDDNDLSFNLYKGDTKLAKVSQTTNYFDKDGKGQEEYTLVPIKDGKEDTESKVSVKAWAKEYMTVPVKQYEVGNYNIDDASVGDVDGDGEYEIIVRRTPAKMFESLYYDEANGNRVVDERVAYPLIEAYKMDGTYLWSINIGKNEVNDVDINFLVYDFDGDGKSEVVMRTYDGTTDGKGNVIGNAKADYTSSLQKQKDRQYLSEGPEYLSVFDGETGAEEARTDLLPVRDPLSSWSSSYTDTSRLTKRASHYLLTTAYLNGTTPSIVMVRGAWDAVKLAAWDYKDKAFNVLWQYDSGASSTLNNAFCGWNHNVAVADVDFDGKDEILSGPAAIDDDGSFMYATNAETAQGEKVKLGHGDAFDVAKMTPDYNGYMVWACHETKDLPANHDLHDARTGQVQLGYSKPKDTGRSRAADIDPTNKGWEMWGSTGTPLIALDGTIVAEPWNGFKSRYSNGNFVKDDETGEELLGSLPMNFKLFWDGDLLSELLDGTTISKWNWNDKVIDILLQANGASNGGTKAVPCLTADLFGDWREEVIWRAENNKELHIYSTSDETEYKIPTLMHDITYREAVAWQNNHYNQPTNTSFYMGAETETVPVPEIKTTSGKVNSVYLQDTDKHAEVSIKKEKVDLEPGPVVLKPVILKIDCPKAIVGGEEVAVDEDNQDVTPIIKDGRTLVPLRFLAQSFKANVDWNDEKREVTITYGEKTIVMPIDSEKYTVNGEEKTLDVPAQIYNDRTIVPIRAILENFDKTFYWYGEKSRVIIGTDIPENPTEEQLKEWSLGL